MQHRHPRPGLAKVRAAPLFGRRNVALVVAHPGPVRDLVEAADVVSEGATRVEGGALVFYGSTSVLFLRASAGGALADDEVSTFTGLLGCDPHLRLRAVRIAHREATARAGGPLATMLAEIHVAPNARGVALLVEVVARLARGDVRKAEGGTAERIASSATQLR